MPPWKPEPGYGEFVGERRLTDAEIDVIQRWVRDGAREGARADLPPPPRLAGWLATRHARPDRGVARVRAAVRRHGPIPQLCRRCSFIGREVRARAGTASRTAAASTTPTSSSIPRPPRGAWIEEDPAPGYSGVIPYSAVFPDGHFLGWTPGQFAPLEPEGQAWRLDPGSDLLVQLHLMPGAEAQRVRPSIGLFFTNDSTGTHAGHASTRPAEPGHPCRRRGVRRLRLVRASGRRRSPRGPAARAPPREGGQGLGIAAGREPPVADLHQPLGFQLAGSVPLPRAVLAAGRHPPHARIHVR